MKIPTPNRKCSPADSWFETVLKAVEDRDPRTSGSRPPLCIPPVAYFGSASKRVYRLLPAGTRTSWILHCMSDEPSFTTQSSSFRSMCNYLDPKQWHPFVFNSESDFAEQMLVYLRQNASSAYPCTTDTSVTLLDFVVDMAQREPERYASINWRCQLQAQIRQEHVGDNCFTSKHCGLPLGDVTLNAFINDRVSYSALARCGITPELYRALRFDIDRERIPWPEEIA